MKVYLPALATLVAVTAAAVTVAAAEPSPACAPILKAMAKTLASDHATFTQIGDRKANGITASGVSYLQIDGVWKTSPLTPKENQAMSDENLKNAKSYVCQPLPDSIIDGVAVTNYHTRTENDGEVVESKIAISKASGLAVQVENQMAGDYNSHYITRYTYTAIHAPTVLK
jgi:hypothetical protein